ncbi:hypothetical protein [Mesorhizobium sp. YR577]|uniref:hypothetical protein n=1 Tax=Mesorhizobium sp. YR577 TaxID=1884373 RepID=UPI001FCDE996|nr:hypothetical protein [Mesorhizobium sp. YR577]
MAALPEEFFVESCRGLVRIDRDWIPSAEGASLYLRPFMIGTEVALETKPATEYLFCVIASPVASYFKGGAAAVTLWVSENFTRAAPGGTGAAKCGGNYAASLAAQAEGQREGCAQVVFLDAIGQAVGLEPLKNLRSVMERDGRRIKIERLAGFDLPVMPPLCCRVSDCHHVIGENPAESRILQQDIPLRRGDRIRMLLYIESQYAIISHYQFPPRRLLTRS